MLGVTIICLGKLKEKYLRDASDEYSKRLSAFCKLNIVELTPEKLSDNPSQKEIDSALETEAKKIMDKIPKGAYICSLCIEGKQISSEELSAILCVECLRSNERSLLASLCCCEYNTVNGNSVASLPYRLVALESHACCCVILE